MPGIRSDSIILLIAGLLSAVQIRAIGTLFGTDLLLTLAFPIVLWKRFGSIDWRHLAPLLLLMVLWLGGQIVSDLVRDTPFVDYARGWARIALMFTGLVTVALISRMRIVPIMAFSVGLAISGVIAATLFPNAYQQGQPWKFGFALPVALLTTALASSVSLRGPAGAAVRYSPLALGALNLFLNYRSMFALLLGTSGMIAIADAFRRRRPGARIASPIFAAVLVIGVIAGGLLAAKTYEILASNGTLGPVAHEKYVQQSQGDLGVILGGRGESLVTLRAIADSPWLGHGSWAKDRYYVGLRVVLLRARGVNARDVGIDSELIPTHSYFFGSWVEAGLLGAVFWAAAFLVGALALIRLVDCPPAAAPFVGFSLLQLLWNIPFSPFGADVRFHVTVHILCAIWVLQQSRSVEAPRRAGQQ
ncbi:hypothetical protein [Phenylobacterium sp. J367]|uniref:hypothetical protein n=1 Tax=Phenylobacterium sp. J367 TaxID=2898435 RepID=UPI00215082C6|nr:hypothetical protein [Phenylobacterium sp. J367]MCR5879506.1 hypothetical protein [Phenylobacterium sp. J367]